MLSKPIPACSAGLKPGSQPLCEVGVGCGNLLQIHCLGKVDHGLVLGQKVGGLFSNELPILAVQPSLGQEFRGYPDNGFPGLPFGCPAHQVFILIYEFHIE